VEEADAGLVVRIPYDQQACNAKLVELLTSPQRTRWQRNGIAFGEQADVYRLVEHAVDRLEALGREDYRRPPPRPELAFCTADQNPHGGVQRAFLRIAVACRDAGHRIRIYAQSWEGRIPDGMDVVIVRARGFAEHTRDARFAASIKKLLAQQPVACVV